MSNVPADLRMAYKILKNAGYVPEEVALQKEIARTEDLLAHCQDEKEKPKQLKKLSFLQFKLECRMGLNSDTLFQAGTSDPFWLLS